MNTVPAISKGDFDHTKSPIFRISVDNSTKLEDTAGNGLLLDDSNDSLRALAIKLWELSSVRGRLPGIREMLGEKWAHFSFRSLIIDTGGGGANFTSSSNIKLDQIGDGLKDLINEGEETGALMEFFLSPLSETLETKQPASFDFFWPVEGKYPRKFNGAALPFGNAKIRSIMIVIEESADPVEVEGESVLNLDESAILSEENGNSGQTSGLSQAFDDINREMPARDVKDFPAQSVVSLISEARVSALNAQEAEEKSRLALYAALSRSYDLAVCAAENPEVFAAQLIFGDDCSESKLAGYIAVLAEALGKKIPQGELGKFLESLDGGIEALIEANSRRGAARENIPD
ncbi:MAG: hypothetical protein R3E21_01905 [Caenibius sp.]